jgi:hypothetical protein
MSLMLVAIMASTVLGLAFKGFGRRENGACLAIAIALTLLYFLRPAYMT